MKRYCFLTAVLVLLLSACVPPPPKSYITMSGKPEAVFQNMTKSQVKDLIIDGMLSRGYDLMESSDNILTFSGKLTSFQEFGAAMTVGNAYSKSYFHLRYTLFEQGPNMVKVIFSSFLETHMPLGQVKLDPIDNNNDFNEIMGFLQVIGGIPQGQRMSDPVPPAESKQKPVAVEKK